MIEEIPTEFKVLEEKYLADTSWYLGLELGDGKIYSANVLRSKFIKKDLFDEESSYFRNLIGAGLTNEVSFFTYAEKHKGNSNILGDVDSYLTHYVNNMFRYLCGSIITADSICAEYGDVCRLANTNMSCKYALKALNEIVREFCRINHQPPVHTSARLAVKDPKHEMLEFLYYVRLGFTHLKTWEMNRYLEGCKQDFTFPYIVFTMDQDHKYYNEFSNLIGENFVNRYLMVYATDKNIPNGGVGYSLYKTMDGKFIFTR